MLKTVKQYIAEQGLWQSGDAVLVALSGGADSVCLLTVLKQLSEEGIRPPVSGGEAGACGRESKAASDSQESDCVRAFQLRAVHVHHGIRGAEADRDEAFVRALCEQLDVPLFVAHCQVPAYAKAHRLSEEEAGRVLRYQVLEEQADRLQAEFLAGSQVKIALAHHRDDNAETILHHLARGSGLTGLAGIRPVQGRRVRPLLCVGRAEIETWLNEHGYAWCEDSTNRSAEYTRNRIRNQVLPMLKSAVNEQAEEHIVQAGQIIGQADDYLRQQAAEIWMQAWKQKPECHSASAAGNDREVSGTKRGSGPGTADGGNQVEIPLAVFRKQPDILNTYLIRHMLEFLEPGWKDITYRHFGQIAELAAKQVGSHLDLPGNLFAQTGYETLIIGKTAQKTGQPGESSLPVLQMTIFSRQKDQEIPKNQYTKWFDYDKIKGTLSVRTRRAGDYLILPSGGRKTIARFMIDEKIPKEKRDSILLLAEEDHVLWVVGYRISEYYKIEQHTQNILQVTCDGGEDYGR